MISNLDSRARMALVAGALYVVPAPANADTSDLWLSACTSLHQSAASAVQEFEAAGFRLLTAADAEDFATASMAWIAVVRSNTEDLSPAMTDHSKRSKFWADLKTDVQATSNRIAALQEEDGHPNLIAFIGDTGSIQLNFTSIEAAEKHPDFVTVSTHCTVSFFGEAPNWLAEKFEFPNQTSVQLSRTGTLAANADFPRVRHTSLKQINVAEFQALFGQEPMSEHELNISVDQETSQ